MNRSWGVLSVIGLAGSALIAVAVPAQATAAQVTRGDFVRIGTLQHEPQLAGRAQLVRNGPARTMLTVHFTGLQPGVVYGVHLHDQPCSAANPGGAHYKFNPTGATTPPNELWASSQQGAPMAGVTANAAGVGRGSGTATWRAGATAQAVVIHAGSTHGGTTAGGPKLACADLR